MFLTCIAGINAMQSASKMIDRSVRPQMFTIIDPLVSELLGNTQWTAIFALFDKMGGAFSVNDYYTPMGKPLLLIAASEGNFLAVKELLERYKAEPNIKSFSGVTPLMAAINNKEDMQIIEMLLGYGADPLQQDNRGFNSLKYAQNYPEILELLEEYTP